MSTGKGFYSYPSPLYQEQTFLQQTDDSSRLYSALEMALVASALLVAAAGVARQDEIDMAWKVGTSLDKGPFEILAERGVHGFLADFKQQATAGRFDPAQRGVVINYLTSML